MADTRLKELSLFDPEIVRPAVWESFRKLAPQHVIKNPVMFVVEIGSVLTTLILDARSDCSPAGIPAALVHVQRQLSGCGSLSFSPTSPKLSPRDAARLRPLRLRKMRKETIARRLVNGKREERFRRPHCEKATLLLLRRER